MAVKDDFNMPIKSGNSLTANGDTLRGTSAFFSPEIDLATSGYGSRDAVNNRLLAYNVDIYDVIEEYKPKSHSVLTVLMGGRGSTKSILNVTSESFNSGKFIHSNFDSLRLRQTAKSTVPYAHNGNQYYNSNTGSVQAYRPASIGQSGYIGGKLDFAAYPADLTGTANTLTSSAGIGASITAPVSPVNVSVNGTVKSLYPLSWKVQSGQTIQGNATDVWENLLHNLVFAGYVKTGVGFATQPLLAAGLGATATIGGTAFEAYSHNGGSQAIFLSFDNLSYVATATYVRKAAVRVKLEAILINSTTTSDEVIMYLNFAESSLNDSGITAMIQQEMYKNGAAFGYTYLSPCYMIDDTNASIEGVPEGSTKSSGQNMKRNFKSTVYHTQIFRQPAWSITGSKQADQKLRFMDDWKSTRADNLAQYKSKLSRAFIFNTMDNTSVFNNTSGQWEEVRTLGGILDRNLWKIKYMRVALEKFNSGMTTSMAASQALDTFMNELAENLTNWNGIDGDKPSLTLFASREMMKDAATLASVGVSGQTNVFGFSSVVGKIDKELSMGLDVVSYDTTWAILNFTHEPALDNMTSFDVPNYMNAGVALNPKRVILALNAPDIIVETFRGDKLQAGIQELGADKYEEDILGEHTIRVKRQRSHALIVLDYV